MRICRALLCVTAVFAFEIVAQAAPFVVFPKAGQLPSPDGRFVVRNTDRGASLSEYVGTFHSLFLEETASGRTRKLCDYVGVAAVAWTSNDLLIVTEYLSKHTSRALIFAADNSRDTVVIDQPLLTNLVPINLHVGIRTGNPFADSREAGVEVARGGWQLFGLLRRHKRQDLIVRTVCYAH